MSDTLKVKVTPDISSQARLEVRTWKAENKCNNAFYKVIEQLDDASCRNCGDYGQVLISFTRAGPFSNVPNHKKGESITWFEGDGECGKGWYIVVITKSYVCHHCDGISKKIPSPDVDKSEAIKQEIEELAEEKSIDGWWNE